MRLQTILLVLSLLLLTYPLNAAPADQAADACPEVVLSALNRTESLCTNLRSNTACYGNDLVTATTWDAATQLTFNQPGDTQNITQLASLATSPMDTRSQTWGIAVLSLRANLPETAAGQNVTFVLYGDTELQGAARPDPTRTGAPFSAPMQAFFLRGGVGRPTCEEAPRDGLLIQAPHGATVNFLINGVRVKVGSTALLELDANGYLATNTLAGSVDVTAAGVTQTVEPGFYTSATDAVPPRDPQPYNYQEVRRAPVELLPEPVQIPLVVPSNADWVDSGVQVTAGQTVILTGSGTVNMWENCETQKFAQGVPDLDCNSLIVSPAGNMPVIGGVPMSLPLSDEYAAPNLLHGALIGRIGVDGEPFLVGERLTLTADTVGTLQFRINDVDYNNAGEFLVTIEIVEDA